ncbi:hypothetical protein GEMRC1_012958 [Eukaryota sp. GEM-RC1]
MSSPTSDQSLLLALCSSISGASLDLAEWNCQKFLDLVGPPVLDAASLVIEHSSLFKPVGVAITEVFAVLRVIKFNKTKSTALAARLLRLTKVAFSSLETVFDLSDSPAVRQVINNFISLSTRITHCLQQYNDSEWFKRTSSRDKFKEEFEDCNNLLENFSSELSLSFNGVTLEKLSTLSSSTIESINTRDEEDFRWAKAIHEFCLFFDGCPLLENLLTEVPQQSDVSDSSSTQQDLGQFNETKPRHRTIFDVYEEMCYPSLS